MVKKKKERHKLQCLMCSEIFENKNGWDGDELVKHLNDEHSGEIIDEYVEQNWENFKDIDEELEDDDD